MIFHFGDCQCKKELYEALQYSGLVTEDMTHKEMCEVLAAKYSESLNLYNYGDECTDITGGYQLFQNGTGGSFVNNTNHMTITANAGYGGNGSVIALTTVNKIDLTNYNEINLAVSCEEEENVYLIVSETSSPTGISSCYDSATIVTGSGETSGNLDITNITGKYYVGLIYGRNNTDTSMSIKMHSLKLS